MSTNKTEQELAPTEALDMQAMPAGSSGVREWIGQHGAAFTGTGATPGTLFWAA